MDWSKLPDLIAVTLLTCAFASVALRSHARASAFWLMGWVLIGLHFAASLFFSAPTLWGTIASFGGLTALVWAGELFQWACVPSGQQRSSLWLLSALLSASLLYIYVLILTSARPWMLDLAAPLFGLLPVAIALLTRKKFNHPLLWTTVILYGALSIFLLVFQNRPQNGGDLALNALLFTVYFACGINFVFMYRRASSGALVTIAGFFTWAAVFVVAQLMDAYFPAIKIESEVWNLPKYVVAVGMILLVLEDQIEYNRHLALHDELTGLPNRRLFHDRLANALERARRNKTEVALLLLDLDDFKLVNDSLGHHTGDKLLKKVSAIFLSRIRRSDTVARTGGDEFCFILEGPRSRTDASHVADSLIRLMDEPLEIDSRMLRIGASVGIAVFPKDADDPEAMCIAADMRMYANKHAGKVQSNGFSSESPVETPGTGVRPDMHRIA